MITNDQIETIFETMKKYEKDNFGMKNGPDFPEIAGELIKSKSFQGVVQGAALVGMLSVIMLPGPGKIKSEDKATEILNNSPLRNVLAGVFYAGFKLGQQSAEVATLESLGGALENGRVG